MIVQPSIRPFPSNLRAAFWMWAGFRAPALGSTGAAKESIKWLAMPSSGGFVVATIAVLVVVLAWIWAGRVHETSPSHPLSPGQDSQS